MVCSKCGYAIPKGQTSCVYCGTKVVSDTLKTDTNAPKRTTSAFAKQMRSSQSESQAVKASHATEQAVPQPVQKNTNSLLTQKSSPLTESRQPANSPFAKKSENVPADRQFADVTAEKPRIVAPYAYRPMYSSFDPNSEDSPFVRKPLNTEPESVTDAQQVQTVSQVTEEKPADTAAEADQATEVSGEASHKKKQGLSIAALTLVFVSLAVFVFALL